MKKYLIVYTKRFMNSTEIYNAIDYADALTEDVINVWEKKLSYGDYNVCIINAIKLEG